MAEVTLSYFQGRGYGESIRITLTLAKIPVSIFYFYRPQQSWGKVIFSVACVKNSVKGGGGGTWAGPPGQVHPSSRYTPLGKYTPWAGTTPRAGTPLVRYTPRQVHSQAGTPRMAGTPPPMVNERAVRILLECILVVKKKQNATKGIM